jgi:hypothetical protein
MLHGTLNGQIDVAFVFQKPGLVNVKMTGNDDGYIVCRCGKQTSIRGRRGRI